ncbi:JAB domain-containing protein [Clostridium sp. WB02_MRS01]|uniref:JAB domain-containing protein n=1 Tax=Clostridium sp. WB02_MRS01 TaxID=2605777 RepID=UPI0012B1D2C3|nr:JAB domain-containing protein [Clostridium sp. WB02_MRS01]MSS10328.1 JAB domain-containing protein [Clostridium sp. WB02_MRS01]
MKTKTQEKKIVDMMKRPGPKKKVSIIHLQMVKEDRTLWGMRCFSSPLDAVEAVRPLFDLADREKILVMSLNAKLEPLAVEVAAVGGVNMCSVDVKNIFKHALLNNASFVICFHNHLSGDPKPSNEDQAITRRIRECGKLLGIFLLDHIIVGEVGFYSFIEQGLIDPDDSNEVA